MGRTSLLHVTARRTPDGICATLRDLCVPVMNGVIDCGRIRPSALISVTVLCHLDKRIDAHPFCVRLNRPGEHPARLVKKRVK
jgi:hypothetical protein